MLVQHTEPGVLELVRSALPSSSAIDSAATLAESLELAEVGQRDLMLIDARGFGGDLAAAAAALRKMLPAAGIFGIADGTPPGPRGIRKAASTAWWRGRSTMTSASCCAQTFCGR